MMGAVKLEEGIVNLSG